MRDALDATRLLWILVGVLVLVMGIMVGVELLNRAGDRGRPWSASYAIEGYTLGRNQAIQCENVDGQRFLIAGPVGIAGREIEDLCETVGIGGRLD